MVKGKYAYLPEYILLTLYNGIQPWLPDKDPEKRFGRMPFLKRVQGKKVPHLFSVISVLILSQGEPQRRGVKIPTMVTRFLPCEKYMRSNNNYLSMS
jgi:hypothetical protein